MAGEVERSVQLVAVPKDVGVDTLAEIRSCWAERHYARVVREAMQTWHPKARCTAQTVFVPLVPVELFEESARPNVRDLYARVSPDMAPAIAAATEDAWTQYRDQLGFDVSEHARIALRRGWLVRESF